MLQIFLSYLKLSVLVVPFDGGKFNFLVGRKASDSKYANKNARNIESAVELEEQNDVDE